MQSAEHGAAWYGAGSYDGKVVRVDKAALEAEVRSPENRHYALCPAFPSKEIDARIDALPDTIDPAHTFSPVSWRIISMTANTPSDRTCHTGFGRWGCLVGEGTRDENDPGRIGGFLIHKRRKWRRPS